MGPFQLLDLGGIDVNFGMQNLLYEQTGDEDFLPRKRLPKWSNRTASVARQERDSTNMSNQESAVEITVSPRQQYLNYCAEGKLAYQYSPSTNHAVFYPRTVSPETGLADLEWRESAGIGTVYATSVVRPRGGEPHNVSVVEVDEGFRLMTQVVDIDPDAVEIGMRVRVTFRSFGEPEIQLPVFVQEVGA